MLLLEVGPEVLFRCAEEAGATGYNRFVRSLFDQNLLCPTWSEWKEGKQPPPLSVGLNFSSADLSNRNWDGFDFRYAWLYRANLSKCSLRQTQLASIREACLRGSDLRGARFHLADLTGTDFTEAQLEGASFCECSYSSRHPPIGLPSGVKSRCKAVTDAEPDEDVVAPSFNLIMVGRLAMV